MARKKRDKKHIGEIYAVHPKHLIPIDQWKDYAKNKGKKKNNNRPVMVMVEKSNKKVQVAKMTTSSKDSDLSTYKKVRLESTYPNKESYVDTRSISKSKMTNKKFRIGEAPLVSKQRKKIHADDLLAVKKARKKRNWNNKKTTK